MIRSDKIVLPLKVSEGAAPPAEEIPRERGGARPGAAVHQWKVGDGSDPEEKERAALKHDGEENNQERGNRVYANILTKKKQS